MSVIYVSIYIYIYISGAVYGLHWCDMTGDGVRELVVICHDGGSREWRGGGDARAKARRGR
jgi:hypothetical protein